MFHFFSTLTPKNEARIYDVNFDFFYVTFRSCDWVFVRDALIRRDNLRDLEAQGRLFFTDVKEEMMTDFACYLQVKF